MRGPRASRLAEPRARRRPGGRVVLVALALLVLHGRLPLAAQTGRLTVRGRVVESGGDRGIAQATVQLGDSARVLTDDAGTFEIRGVRPGRYALVVEALGYRTVRTALLVTDDATGTIRMEPEPIALDTLRVRPSRFDLGGRVLARDGRRPVPFVTVRLEAGGETASNDAGHFNFDGLPRGRHVVVVEGFGWLPLRAAIELDSDTSVVFELERDGITQRIIQRQIARLDERLKGSGYRIRVYDREEILDSRAATPVDILRLHLVPCAGSGRMGCTLSNVGRPGEPMVWIDDHLTFCGLELLNTFPNTAIERMELVGGGIRVYTVWHIERMAAGRVGVPPFIPYERRFSC